MSVIDRDDRVSSPWRIKRSSRLFDFFARTGLSERVDKTPSDQMPPGVPGVKLRYPGESFQRSGDPRTSKYCDGRPEDGALIRSSRPLRQAATAPPC